MVEPKNAIFLYEPSTSVKPGYILIGDIRRRAAYGDWSHSLGACCSGWQAMDDEQVYQAMHWLALEIAEFSGVPIRMIRDEMEKVDGYREYARRVGEMALGRS